VENVGGSKTDLVGDVAAEDVTLEAVMVNEVAEREIDRAVRGRRGIARTYVKWIRRRNPDSTPAEVIEMLERNYVMAISVAGAAITVGTIAAEIGISMIPIVGAAAVGAKSTLQSAGKTFALGVAKQGAATATAMLPAGDERLQFEITAILALAIADIHGMDLDQDQAHALVYLLSNGRVSSKQIDTMASALAESPPSGTVSTGQLIASGRADWGHWANTLADALPGEAAQGLVRGVQTGSIEGIRSTLDGKQQAAVEYGVGALVGGVTRFVFGRDVVDATRSAFAAAPLSFPNHLAPEAVTDSDKEVGDHNRALGALEDAARTVGAGVTVGATVVGASVTRAAGVVSRPFRSVDLDGDGVPDEAQVLTAVKGIGGALTGAAGVLGKFVASPFKPK